MLRGVVLCCCCLLPLAFVMPHSPSVRPKAALGAFGESGDLSEDVRETLDGWRDLARESIEATPTWVFPVLTLASIDSILVIIRWHLFLDHPEMRLLASLFGFLCVSIDRINEEGGPLQRLVMALRKEDSELDSVEARLRTSADVRRYRSEETNDEILVLSKKDLPLVASAHKKKKRPLLFLELTSEEPSVAGQVADRFLKSAPQCFPLQTLGQLVKTRASLPVILEKKFDLVVQVPYDFTTESLDDVLWETTTLKAAAGHVLGLYVIINRPSQLPLALPETARLSEATRQSHQARLNSCAKVPPTTAEEEKGS